MVEYNELVTKKGKHLIFCDLEELLKEFFKAEDVKPFLKGPEYIMHCPFCKEQGHTKHKLYIKSDFSMGHCFVCGKAFINVTDEIKFDIRVPEFMSSWLREPFKVVPLTDPEWTLEKYEYECDDFDQKGYDYLVGRHKFLGDLYEILGFKFLDGNVVMPFKYHGEVFYYQIRFSGKSKIRYFFPPISKKPPYIIEHGDNSRIVLVEGIFDAVAMLIQAPEFTPVAVMGHTISDYQLEFIREYVPKEIVVYMDKTEYSKQIADRVKSVIDYCPIRIIKSNGQDPEENLIKRIKKGQDLVWLHGNKY